jgi:protein-disulfide isomerase
MLEFADFDCAFCKQFARDILPTISREYIDSGKLLLAFRHFPSPLHPDAAVAGAGADCAGEQGRFWEMHDRLFKDGLSLGSATVNTLAVRLGLDVRAFDTCLRGSGRAAVLTDSALAEKLGIRGTPAFLLGSLRADGRVSVKSVLPGLVGLDRFRAAIESIARMRD